MVTHRHRDAVTPAHHASAVNVRIADSTCNLEAIDSLVAVFDPIGFGVRGQISGVCGEAFSTGSDQVIPFSFQIAPH